MSEFRHDPNHFLHQRDNSLHKSGPVEFIVNQARRSGERVPENPGPKISTYLESIGRHSLLVKIPQDNPPEAFRMLHRRKKQIGARVIKAEDFPDSFFDTQARAYREQGHGNLEITDELRSGALGVVQTDQRESLDDWVDYLADEESNYPNWFKYYALSGITKLEDFDKEKQEFPRRSRSTTNPFPALNREALSLVYNDISGYFGDYPYEDQDEHEVLHLIKGGNFGKLYAYALAEVGFTDPELLEEANGSWVKYDKSKNTKDVARLSGSLRGYGTGWCTAGEGYASMQLSQGDFYVFYSRDKDGVDRVPRIAIRTVEGRVAEVRGIVGGGQNLGPGNNTRQEIEPLMLDIALDKLGTLQGGEVYLQSAQDMKLLTEIDNKTKKHPNRKLAAEEIRFLYEFDHQIKGFGYKKDPRIQEIIQRRSFLPDMKHVLRVGTQQEVIDRLLAEKLQLLVDRASKFPPAARNLIMNRFLDNSFDAEEVFDVIVKNRHLSNDVAVKVATLCSPTQMKNLMRSFKDKSFVFGLYAWDLYNMFNFGRLSLEIGDRIKQDPLFAEKVREACGDAVDESDLGYYVASNEAVLNKVFGANLLASKRDQYLSQNDELEYTDDDLGDDYL